MCLDVMHTVWKHILSDIYPQLKWICPQWEYFSYISISDTDYKCIVWLFLRKYFWKKIKCQNFWCFSNNIFRILIFVQEHIVSRYIMIINYLKYTNNIPAQFFRYLLFYIKSDMISITTFDITFTYLPL